MECLFHPLSCKGSLTLFTLNIVKYIFSKVKKAEVDRCDAHCHPKCHIIEISVSAELSYSITRTINYWVPINGITETGLAMVIIRTLDDGTGRFYQTQN